MWSFSFVHEIGRIELGKSLRVVDADDNLHNCVLTVFFYFTVFFLRLPSERFLVLYELAVCICI